MFRFLKSSSLKIRFFGNNNFSYPPSAVSGFTTHSNIGELSYMYHFNKLFEEGELEGELDGQEDYSENSSSNKEEEDLLI